MKYEVGQIVSVCHTSNHDVAIAQIVRVKNYGHWTGLLLNGERWAKSFEISDEPEYWTITVLDMDEMQFKLITL